MSVFKHGLLSIWKQNPDIYSYPEDATFKQGDRVLIHKAPDPDFIGHVDKVVWANNTGDGIEYMLFDYPWLIWQHLLREA